MEELADELRVGLEVASPLFRCFGKARVEARRFSSSRSRSEIDLRDLFTEVSSISDHARSMIGVIRLK